MVHVKPHLCPCCLPQRDHFTITCPVTKVGSDLVLIQTGLSHWFPLVWIHHFLFATFIIIIIKLMQSYAVCINYFFSPCVVCKRKITIHVQEQTHQCRNSLFKVHVLLLILKRKHTCTIGVSLRFWAGYLHLTGPPWNSIDAFSCILKPQQRPSNHKPHARNLGQFNSLCKALWGDFVINRQQNELDAV